MTLDLYQSNRQYGRRLARPGQVRHSLFAPKAVLIYHRPGNLRATTLLFCHSEIESTARYLGIEFGDAIEIAEKIDI
jgi:hypothetical protein